MCILPNQRLHIALFDMDIYQSMHSMHEKACNENIIHVTVTPDMCNRTPQMHTSSRLSSIVVGLISHKSIDHSLTSLIKIHISRSILQQPHRIIVHILFINHSIRILILTVPMIRQYHHPPILHHHIRRLPILNAAS